MSVCLGFDRRTEGTWGAVQLSRYRVGRSLVDFSGVKGLIAAPTAIEVVVGLCLSLNIAPELEVKAPRLPGCNLVP